MTASTASTASSSSSISSADRSKAHSEPEPSPETAGHGCDFCGDRVAAVRRVALDVEYDRLQKAHKELYACHSCFEAKEEARTGLNHR